MSRRREAAELARVLALSTQQTRDIAEISPHSLSSEHAGETQDSREMELKMMHPRNRTPTGLSEDEVALFSSRSGEDDANASRIQSFNPSEPLHDSPAQASPSRHHDMPAPLAYVRRQQNVAVPEDTVNVHTWGASSGNLSPTQLSIQAAPIVAADAILPCKETHVPILQQRTPLRRKASNQAFQLSSSPVEASSSFKRSVKPIDESIDVGSDPDEIEIIESIRPTPASKRSKLRPEIILQSKSAPRVQSRHYSPDPLDLIPSGSTATLQSTERHSAQPRSSAAGSSNTGNERKSSRVKAAADKKELEREEKRRIRRERKAKEEEERMAKGVPKPSSKSTSKRKSIAPATAAKPNTDSGATNRTSRQEASEAQRSSSTPAAVENLPSESAPTRLATPRTAKPLSHDKVASPERFPAHPPEDATEELVQKEPSSPILIDEKAPSPQPSLHEDEHSIPRKPDSRSDPRLIDPRRRELTASASSAKQSPGPSGPDGRPQRPDGIRWQTTRNDLSGVLAKFGGARQTGMSKRHRIAPLHAKIGPPAKALPPVPQKPVKRKKGDESEDEDSEEGDSEDENGVRKSKSKAKGMEWFMMED